MSEGSQCRANQPYAISSIVGLMRYGARDGATSCPTAWRQSIPATRPAGTREVTPEGYAAEIAAARERLPNICFDIHDYAIAGDRAWFRFTMRWTDLASSQPRSRAGVQIYRVEGGKLAETWVTWRDEDSAWPDAGRPWKNSDFPPARN